MKNLVILLFLILLPFGLFAQPDNIHADHQEDCRVFHFGMPHSSRVLHLQDSTLLFLYQKSHTWGVAAGKYYTDGDSIILIKDEETTEFYILLQNEILREKPMFTNYWLEEFKSAKFDCIGNVEVIERDDLSYTMELQ